MGVTRIKANFLVTANDQDITTAIAERFISLHLTDETGINADMLEITLADHDPLQPIQRPPKGAELRVSLGWDDEPLTPMGMFVCDEIEMGGWPGYMTIKASAAIYEATPKGKVDLQTQKARSWPKGTKLGAMVAKIAKEHGMESVVAKNLAGVVLPQFDQTEESDISFLLRVAKRYDAIIKPAGGKLVMSRRGDSRSASGDLLPVASIVPGQVTSWSLTESSKEAPGTVVAYWHSTKAGKKNKVTVGKGEPVKRMRQFYPTKAAAKDAADAELRRRMRGQVNFNCSTEGDPLLGADSRLLLPSGLWRDGVAGEWLIKRVEHTLDASGGYSCSLAAEVSTESDEEPSAPPAGEVSADPDADE